MYNTNSAILIQRKKYSKLEALAKLERFCSGTERCEADILQKIYTWGLSDGDKKEIIEKLKEENFLNEERFSNSYVRGKFNYKHRGKIKLKMELNQKGIDSELIKDALSKIEEEDYLSKIEHLTIKKLKSIKDTDAYTIKNKLFRYLTSKGFEGDLSMKIIQKIVDHKSI